MRIRNEVSAMTVDGDVQSLVLRLYHLNSRPACLPPAVARTLMDIKLVEGEEEEVKEVGFFQCLEPGFEEAFPV